MAASKKRSKHVSTHSQAPRALPVQSLRWRCDPGIMPFSSTSEVEPAPGIVGQDAAVEALTFGLETDAPGQNIFVRGLSGSGRLTLVRELLEEIRPACPRVKDCCYVHNFGRPDRPRLIALAAGKGEEFRGRVDRIADFIRDNLKTALSSEGVKARRDVLDQTTKKQLDEIVAPFEKSLRASGLTLVSVEAGPVVQTGIFPLVDGKAVPPEEFDRLHAQGEVSDEQYAAARDSYDEFERQLNDVNEKATEIRRKHDEAVASLLEKSARSILDKIVRSIESAFPEPSVRTFLEEVTDDVVKYRLRANEDETDFTRLYRVNVVSEHEQGGSCPTILENVPTVRNLLGSIDQGFEAGDEIRPGHMGIRAGSLLRADGGYLVLEGREVLDEPDAWKVLKRVLRTGRLEISPPEIALGGWSTSLKPEPIDINVKVVLLGEPDTYSLLDENDPDFPQLFKVLADFDTVIPRNEAGVNQYAAVLARIGREEHLPPFDRSAVAALAEHGARIAARDGKLTARFGRIADVAREAAFIASRQDRPQVVANDIREAVRRRKRRADLPSRRFRELVADGTIRVDTSGSIVGQINGLAVLQAGPMVYGFPMRITATIGPGTAGVINIQREAALSGAIHTKGFYILGGLLRLLLRTEHPLTFNASVAFEQSYGSIDGDSASGAEMCCLLSALTDVPLRQDLAMTGAIDQMGHILAVGAINEKIEGFFDTCRDVGLTGTQGVVIPQANDGDLSLREDVVEACADGRFHVYAVQSIHQALEILAGTPAGAIGKGGRYPRGTLLGIAVERAREYWLRVARLPVARKPRSRKATSRTKKRSR